MPSNRSDEGPILDPSEQEQLRLEAFGSPPKESNEYLGRIVLGASMLGLMGLQAPFLFIKHAPFMATPSRKVRDALSFLQRHRQSSQKPPVFVDLGSGDGQAVYEAAKLGYKAFGIEFNWTLWALSSFRRLFWSSDVKRRSRFYLQDFSHYNLKEANTVMIFAVPRTMPILGKKIQSECKNGTTVMAYRFEMPLAKSGTLDGGLRATCIYDRDEMRIYRMKP